MRITLPLACALAAGLSIAACTGGGLTGSAPPQAILQGRFDTKTGSDCSIQGSQVGVGTFADGGTPIPVMDGSQGELGVNHIACRVHDKGGKQSFDVSGSIMSDDRLLFSIEGVFPASTTAAGFPVQMASLSNGIAGNLQVFSETDNTCIVLYNTEKQGATAGRVWAEITCPAAKPSGDAGAGTCTTIAEFRFEDCKED